MQSVLSDGNLARSPRETVKAVVKGLAELYASCPGLHRLLAIEGLRVTKAERVYAFDMRVVGIIRHFLAALTSKAAPIRRKNVDAAAFVAFQSVRATMLASLLERPPGPRRGRAHRRDRRPRSPLSRGRSRASVAIAPERCALSGPLRAARRPSRSAARASESDSAPDGARGWSRAARGGRSCTRRRGSSARTPSGSGWSR